jgi:hypothetical protein
MEKGIARTGSLHQMIPTPESGTTEPVALKWTYGKQTPNPPKSHRMHVQSQANTAAKELNAVTTIPVIDTKVSVIKTGVISTLSEWAALTSLVLDLNTQLIAQSR